MDLWFKIRIDVGWLRKKDNLLWNYWLTQNQIVDVKNRLGHGQGLENFQGAHKQELISKRHHHGNTCMHSILIISFFFYAFTQNSNTSFDWSSLITCLFPTHTMISVSWFFSYYSFCVSHLYEYQSILILLVVQVRNLDIL